MALLAILSRHRRAAMLGGIAAMLTAVGLATGPSAGAATGEIAVLGCSNTGQAAQGYLRLSTLDLLADADRPSIGGGTLQKWADGVIKYWGDVEMREPAEGYAEAWVNICLKDEDASGAMTATHQAQITAVVDRLASDFGISAGSVHVNALQSYPPGHVCGATGSDGIEVANEIADWASANLGTARGPLLSVDADGLDADGCHLDPSGEEQVGGQLVGYFDEAGGDDEYTVSEGGSLSVPAPGVLANDGLGSGATAELVSGVTYGSLTLRADGSFEYDHDGGEVPSDGFVYRATDNGEEITATVTISVTAVDDLPSLAVRLVVAAPIVSAEFTVTDPDDATHTMSVAWGDGTISYLHAAAPAVIERTYLTTGEFDVEACADDSTTVVCAVDSVTVDEAGEHPFTDLSGSVHVVDIAELWSLDVTRGCNPPANDRFCPRDDVTRGEMAAFLSRLLGLPAGSGDPFTDDDGSVFEEDIEALSAAGVTKGCNPPANDRFCPNAPVSRGEMAAFLDRALGLPDEGDDRFGDDDDSEFERHIDRIAAAGITLGCNPPNNDRFCPADPVTRQQMASFLIRADRWLAAGA